MRIDIISNGGFDADGNFWNFTSNGSTVVGEEDVIVKNKYCQVYQTEAVFQQIPLENGRSYLVKLKVRGGLRGTLSVMKMNTNDAYWQIDINSSLSNSWVEESHLFTAGDWARELTLHFRAANGATTSYLELDNISLTETSR